MRMNLCICFHSTMCQTESRDCKIQIFCIPVWSSERQFFSQGSFVDLYHPDSICFKIQYFISDCKCNLRDGFLNGNVFSWEWPVQYRNRACQHSFHDLIRKWLCIYGPIYRNRLFTIYIAPDDRWFYASGSVRLYPGFFCKKESSQCFAKILHHIISFIFSVYQYIKSDFFLPCHTFRDFLLVEIHIFLSGNLSLSKGRPVCLYIFRLWERSNRRCRELRKSKSLFLQFLTFTSLWLSDIIRFRYMW